MTPFDDTTASDEAVRAETDVAPGEPAGDTEPEVQGDLEAEDSKHRVRQVSWGRMLAYGVLPAVALLLAMGAGYLKWVDMSARESAVARIQSVQAATDGTVAMLSYKPDTVEKDLGAARDRLTGDFEDAYTSLTHDVVIPGAKEKQISAMANVAAAASVSATANHAVVLVFVNQTVTIGNGAPTNTASSVKVSLDRVDGRWLISGFDPV